MYLGAIMHVLRLPLRPTESDKHILEKRFCCIWHVHNVVVKYAKKQLNKLFAEKEYTMARIAYYQVKEELCKLFDNDDNKLSNEHKTLMAKKNELIKVMQAYTNRYHLTKNDLEKYAVVQSHKFSHLLSSTQVQKEADRVYSGVDKVLYSNGKDIKFKLLKNTTTICGKTPKNGVRYYDADHTSYYPKKVKPVFSEEIEYLGLHIKVKVNTKDLYIVESLRGDISFCELKRIMFKDGWHYYVNLYIRSDAPNKRNSLNICKEVQGMDLGVSTAAVVSDTNVILEELAPKSVEYEKRIKELQRKIDRSKRITNPNNYHPDGTIKKGCRKWFYSKNCLRNMRLLTVLIRKKAMSKEHAHYILANKILDNGIYIYTEAMIFYGLQHRSKKKTERQTKTTTVITKDGTKKTIKKFKRKKRFGHSLANRSPAKFSAILERKAKALGGFLKKVNTKSFKASQYRHDTDTYERLPLSQRSKIINGHKVQRDLYSAFLIRNTNIDLKSVNRTRCETQFSNCVTMSTNYISKLKNRGISYSAVFGF